MFNEILTGKASLETKPKDPYREPDVPDVTVPCDQCRRTFTKKATGPATKCVQCHMDNAAREAALTQNAYASPEATDAGWRVTKAFLWIGLVVLLGIVKWQMHSG